MNWIGGRPYLSLFISRTFAVTISPFGASPPVLTTVVGLRAAGELQPARIREQSELVCHGGPRPQRSRRRGDLRQVACPTRDRVRGHELVRSRRTQSRPATSRPPATLRARSSTPLPDELLGLDAAFRVRRAHRGRGSRCTCSRTRSWAPARKTAASARSRASTRRLSPRVRRRSRRVDEPSTAPAAPTRRAPSATAW